MRQRENLCRSGEGTVIEYLLDAVIEEAGYGLDEVVLSDVTIRMASGELVGLIGPNGAGKSTAIKTLLGQMSHVVGEVQFAKGRLDAGYVPEHPVWYEELTLWEHLELAAAVYELKEEQWQAKAAQLLERFRMSAVRHQLPGSFSKGMQQKMMLIQCFMHSPELYIVDEPFIGLDPKAMKDLLDVLQEERERGAAVLLCTHVLDTAERLCDRFILLSDGTVRAEGTLPDIRRQCGLPGGTLFECFHSLI